MLTGVDTLFFCCKYIIAFPIFTTGVVLKLNTLPTVYVIGPLLHQQPACWLVARWVDGLVAWIYKLL